MPTIKKKIPKWLVIIIVVAAVAVVAGLATVLYFVFAPSNSASCHPVNAVCANDAECCPGSRCHTNYTCQPCTAAGKACSPASGCCPGLACDAGVCTACNPPGRPCPCCGSVECLPDGTCGSCLADGSVCSEATDCCEGSRCAGGRCCTGPLCGTLQASSAVPAFQVQQLDNTCYGGRCSLDYSALLEFWFWDGRLLGRESTQKTKKWVAEPVEGQQLGWVDTAPKATTVMLTRDGKVCNISGTLYLNSIGMTWQKEAADAWNIKRPTSGSTTTCLIDDDCSAPYKACVDGQCVSCFARTRPVDCFSGQTPVCYGNTDWLCVDKNLACGNVQTPPVCPVGQHPVCDSATKKWQCQAPQSSANCDNVPEGLECPSTGVDSRYPGTTFQPRCDNGTLNQWTCQSNCSSTAVPPCDSNLQVPVCSPDPLTGVTRWKCEPKSGINQQDQCAAFPSPTACPNDALCFPFANTSTYVKKCRNDMTKEDALAYLSQTLDSSIVQKDGVYFTGPSYKVPYAPTRQCKNILAGEPVTHVPEPWVQAVLGNPDEDIISYPDYEFLNHYECNADLDSGLCTPTENWLPKNAVGVQCRACSGVGSLDQYGKCVCDVGHEGRNCTLNKCTIDPDSYFNTAGQCVSLPEFANFKFVLYENTYIEIQIPLKCVRYRVGTAEVYVAPPDCLSETDIVKILEGGENNHFLSEATFKCGISMSNAPNERIERLLFAPGTNMLDGRNVLYMRIDGHTQEKYNYWGICDIDLTTVPCDAAA